MNKKLKISVITGSLIVLCGTGSYLFYNVQKKMDFDNLVISAEKLMDSKKYEEAEKIYGQALDIKKDDKVSGKIEEINKIKEDIKKLDDVDKLINDGKLEDAAKGLEDITYESKDINERVNSLKDKIDEKNNEIIKEKEKLKAEEEKKVKAEQEASVKKAEENKNENNSKNVVSNDANRSKQNKDIPRSDSPSMSTDEAGMEYTLNKFEKEKKIFKLNINGKVLNITANDRVLPPTKGYLTSERFLKAGVAHFVEVRKDLDPEKMKFEEIAADGSFYLSAIDGKKVVYSCEFSLYSDEILCYYSSK